MKKNILIIGCMGHIGFSLAKYFSHKNYNVFGFYNNTLDKFKLTELKKLKIKLFKNNLSNPKKILSTIRKNKITDCVYASAIAHDSIAKFRPHDTLSSIHSIQIILLILQKKDYR